MTVDTTYPFNDLPGADTSTWCHVCGMPRSAVDPLVTRGNDLLCHMCAYEAMTAELAALRDELEQVKRERDEARATRDELQEALSAGAYTSPDLSDFYLSIIERKRRTIDALVVAARAAIRVVYTVAQSCFLSKEACISALRGQITRAQQAENTAQFRAYLMGKNPDYLKQPDRKAAKE